jgi:ABC-2 type transport system ATP-binding protein
LKREDFAQTRDMSASMISDDGNVLEAIALEVTYKDAPVLRGLDLSVRRGEIYALLGGNGAGKSTTLNAFLGFVRPRSGQIRVCGMDVGQDLPAIRARLAYVPENVALYEHLTARENIDYFMRLAGSVAKDGAAIESALTAVGLESESWDRRLAGFSKGMRQKVAIALALARSVPVLLLDEPNTGLDPKASSEFNHLLQSLRAQGVAIFMVTHDLLSATEVADRIGFLSRGRIEEEFSADGPERFDVRELYRRYSTNCSRS